jgi:putative transposon-encoded protein
MVSKKKVELTSHSEIEIKFDNVAVKKQIVGVFEREAKGFGNSARVDCPLEYLGRKVYLVVCR